MINQMCLEDGEVRKQILSELQWLKVFGTSSRGVVNDESDNGNQPAAQNQRPLSARPQQTIVAPAEFFCPITRGDKLTRQLLVLHFNMSIPFKLSKLQSKASKLLRPKGFIFTF